MRERTLEYFLSDAFKEKEEISLEELWNLSSLIPENQFTGQSFEEMFVLISDDGEHWLNWNGQLKHIIQETNAPMFF